MKGEHSELVACVDTAALSCPLDAEAFVELLRARFDEHIPYVMCARACVSVNPYAWRDIYSAREESAYARAADYDDALPAHLYRVVERARRRLRRAAQTLVVTGESGAGKTEVARLSLQYLSRVSLGADSRESSPLIEDVLRANHVLEFLGNAETEHNGNSSRFGKLLALRYCGDGTPAGARLSTYLLERCRVVAPRAPNGAYRVFYAIIDDPSANDEYALHAMPRDLLGREHAAVPSAWDTLSSLCRALALDARTLRTVQQTAVAVLTLNLRDFASFASIIDADDVAHTLLHRRMVVGTDVIWTACESREVKARCRALAMHLYQGMFDATVRALNERLDSPTEGAALNVLDLFGFECMGKARNDLEQLCINYANERLHKLFVDHAVLAQAEMHRAEGLAPSSADRPAPDHRGLEACERHVFRLLDEAERTRTSASGLVAAIVHTAPVGAVQAPMVRVDDARFTLHHYARPVEYAAIDFVARNSDGMRPELLEMIASSRNPCMGVVGQGAAAARAATTTERRFAPSVVSAFRKDMDAMLNVVGGGEVHFVRCLRPNARASPDEFDAELVRSQIASSGLVEACAVARGGYEHQVPHAELQRRFGRLGGLLHDRVVAAGGAWGRTRAFLHARAYAALAREDAALAMQAAGLAPPTPPPPPAP